MKIKFPLLTIAILLSLTINSYAGVSSKATHALLIDADTHTVLYQKNAKSRMAPSSMTKLMTVYIAFERLKSGALDLDSKVLVSKKAWSKGGSRTFLPLNSEVSVDTLLKGIIVQSGNDASIALSEAIAGSEEAFADRMNAVAKQIGLKNSHFVNSTGWPNPNHYMTTEDLAILATRVINDFPEYYHYFSQEEFTYNRIKQMNRNVLIRRNHLGVDGLKTGHTQEAGYSITASAKQGDRRLIAVVSGLKNATERARETQKLLQYGFLNYTNVTLAKANEPIASAKVQLGSADNVNLVCEQNLIFTVPVEQKDHIEAVVNYKPKLAAPIRDRTKVGILEVKLPNQETKKFDLCTKGDVLEAGLVSRVYQKSKNWISSIGSSSNDNENTLSTKVLLEKKTA